jgi:large subunit ribosomal protein L11
MAKKITKVIKLAIPAGKANPAPPIGTALGPAGLNIAEFCKKYNDATKDKMGEIIPCIINVYEDRTYDFVLKTPPASSLILKAVGVEKGSGEVPKKKIGKITKAQVKEIAEKKMPDLNAKDLPGAIKIIEGQCKSMGVDVI